MKPALLVRSLTGRGGQAATDGDFSRSGTQSERFRFLVTVFYDVRGTLSSVFVRVFAFALLLEKLLGFFIHQARVFAVKCQEFGA